MQAPSLIPLLVLLILSATADLRGYRTVRNGRVLVTLGSWSYALDLFHSIVFTILATSGRITAIVVSGLVYVLVEKPAERIIRAAGTQSPRNTPVMNG